jgi:hypothetical protein
MAIGLKLGRQVIALDNRFSLEGVFVASTPQEAVRLAMAGACGPQSEAR